MSDLGRPRFLNLQGRFPPVGFENKELGLNSFKNVGFGSTSCQSCSFVGVRPGGMRVAIESAALVVDKSWRVESKAQLWQKHVRPLQRSQTLPISPPTAPAHSAGPTNICGSAALLIFISLEPASARAKKDAQWIKTG